MPDESAASSESAASAASSSPTNLPPKPPRRWLRWRDPDLAHAWRWFVLSSLVGGVAGVGAIAFYYLSAGLAGLCLRGLAGYHAGGPQKEPPFLEDIGGPTTIILPMLILLPMIGNFLAGWLALKFAPEAKGHGTDAAIDAYHRKRGVVSLRTTIVKLIASALTLGSGGSGGREGPIAQIGAGFGSWIGTKFRLTPMDRRILLAAGLAAGIGAIFRAPLAAAIFSAEILYRRGDFESEVLLPSMLSSIMAYCVFSVVTGDFSALFTIYADGHSLFTFANPLELVPYTVLAFLVSLAGALFVFVFYRVEHVFSGLKRVPEILRPAIGGALTGLVAVALFLIAQTLWAPATTDATLSRIGESALSVLSFGYGILQSLIDTHYAEHHGFVTFRHADAGILVPLLLMIALGKMLTTSLTIGSGGSAGVFGPSMVIGGALGGAVGAFFLSIGWIHNPEAFVIVGMAGFFAGVAKTPISTVIMVAELTSSYGLLIPAVWVCTLATLILGSRASLYRKQPNTRADSLAHRGDFLVDVFRGMRVGDLIPHRLDEATPVTAGKTLAQFVPEIIQSRDSYFPVIDGKGRLLGIFSLNDIREVLYDEGLADLVTAADIATTHPIKLRTSDDLNEALSKFTVRGYESLPVVADGDENRLVGMLTRRALLAEYTDRLHSLKQTDGDSVRMPRISPD